LFIFIFKSSSYATIELNQCRGADEDQIGAVVDEGEVQELIDLPLGDSGLVLVVEFLQGLIDREMGQVPVALD
jgi:hypothetical protein